MKTITQACLVLALTSGCATLAPPQDRVLRFTEKTLATRSDAYNAALVHFAKNIQNSNAAIRFQNEKSGQIVLKSSVSCNVFRQFGDINEYSLSFNLDLKFSDKSVQMSFEDLQVIGPSGQPTGFEYNQITSRQRANEARPCVDAVKLGILQSIPTK